MQSYGSRLQELKTRFTFDFGVSMRGMRVFGHHPGEYEEMDGLIARLLEELHLKVHTLVELGVNWGASLFMLARFAEKRANLIGVDVGEFPGIVDVDTILGALRRERFRVSFLQDKTQRSVGAVERFAPIDLLHIDADHSYQSSRHDWDAYTPMVRKNGIILLHDIRHCDGVRRMFEERKPTLERFVEITDGNRGMAVVVKTW